MKKSNMWQLIYAPLIVYCVCLCVCVRALNRHCIISECLSCQRRVSLTPACVAVPRATLTDP